MIVRMRDRERLAMVQRQILARGVADGRVLAAMQKVERHRFVPPSLQPAAYDDAALRLGPQQSISQPYIVARMLEALQLRASDRVLDVGTGSGYQAALLAELCAEVFSIERDPSLAATAVRTLRELGYHGVQVLHGDGTEGWAGAAPFDAIVVGAGAASVPAALRAQLAIGGRLLMPVGPPRLQQIVRFIRIDAEQFEEQSICGAHFVPLVGSGVEPW